MIKHYIPISNFAIRYSLTIPERTISSIPNSITSITSHYNKQIFLDWRKRVGNVKADKITKAATTRGTDMHTLTEYYLKNEELPQVPPISEFLFKISKGKLNKISKIRTLEGALYSKQLGIAGTVD